MNRSCPEILLVDDDANLCELITELIGAYGNVSVSQSWFDAKRRLGEKRFDLVILDIYLPDAGVLEPLEHIRELDPDYPVVLISGNLETNDTLVERAMRLGVNHILPKPFDFEKLFNVISQYLQPA